MAKAYFAWGFCIVCAALQLWAGNCDAAQTWCAAGFVISAVIAMGDRP